MPQYQLDLRHRQQFMKISSVAVNDDGVVRKSVPHRSQHFMHSRVGP